MAELWQGLTASPTLILIVLLTAGVIFVNGWTDAPNAIASCVTTRAMRPGYAIGMAAVCNLAGVAVMSLLAPQVAATMQNIVRLDGENAAAALAAALIAIVLWAVCAWTFGIPTSESHALIAGLTGAAIALRGWQGVVWGQWTKVLYGLFLSVLLGFGLGYAVCRAVVRVCRNKDRRKTERFFTYAQIAGGAANAFMHGAQDGQKFIGILLLGMSVCGTTVERLPMYIVVFCALLMGLGTSMGGKRIIRSVGRDLVRLRKYQGFSADVASAVSLLAASLCGLPVSTTHTKTTAIMGIGAVNGLRKLRVSVVKDMVLAWILTFPFCGLLGYAAAGLFVVFR